MPGWIQYEIQVSKNISRTVYANEMIGVFSLTPVYALDELTKVLENFPAENEPKRERPNNKLHKNLNPLKKNIKRDI